MRYVVVYCMGGAANARWRNSLAMSRREADATRADLVRMGYPAYVREALDLAKLPEGPDPSWDYSTLRWKA